MSFFNKCLWGTRKGKTNSVDRKTVRAEFIELVIFLIFLLVTTIVALSSRHLYMFYFNKTIDDLFLAIDLEFESREGLRFNQLVTSDDWWRFLEFTVLPDLHDDNAPDDRKLLQENLLLGPPRLRQIRVQEKSCHIHQAFTRYFDKCYDAYSSSIEDKRDEYKGTKFNTLDELYATTLWAKFSSYVGGGYTKPLSFEYKENIQILQDLKSKEWIDRGTRVVIFEMSLFNANTQLFSSAKFIAEFPPTGGMIPSSKLQVLKRYSIWYEGDYLLLVSAIVFYILAFYYLIEEILEMPNFGVMNYVRSLWNMVDLTIILIAFISLFYNIWHTYYLNQLIERFSKDPDHFHSLDIICFWNLMYIDMMAICTFIVWIKLFKYISFNKTMLQFSNTFKRCAKDLFGFTVMFTIVFLAYAQLGLILFGSRNPDFRTFKDSFITMIRMVLGDFDYGALEEVNRIMGPIFFISFTIIVFFILLNMFIAIITDTYTEVKNEFQHGDKRLQNYISSMFFKWYRFLRNCCSRKEREKRSDDEDLKSVGIPETESEITIYPRSSRQPPPAFPIKVRKRDVYKEYFEEVIVDQNAAKVTSLTQRVEHLEQILEQLIVNLDEILKRVDSKNKPKR